MEDKKLNLLNSILEVAEIALDVGEPDICVLLLSVATIGEAGLATTGIHYLSTPLLLARASHDSELLDQVRTIMEKVQVSWSEKGLT